MSIQKNPLLKETLDKCSRVFIIIAVFGLAINLLMLTAPLFMMQVFDRVITSRNTDTLILLMLIAALALLTMALLEGVRTFILVRMSRWLDGQIGGAALTASIMSSLATGREASIQALRDLSTFRSFLTGPGIFPILDAPFAPIFLGVMFLLHPVLGWIALIGAMVLLGVGIINERFTRKLLAESNGQQMIAMKQAETASRNADVIEAMGMMPQLIKRWNARHADSLALQAQASDRGGILSAASKFVRVMLQIAVTGAGAWLVIQAEMSPGAMIAGSIIMGRALAPVEQAIGSWKGFLTARAAYSRLKVQLESSPPAGTDLMPLPRPKGAVSVEGLSYTHVNTKEPILRNINFRLDPGEVLGIIGPTAAGKTTLVRLLVGNLKPRFGHARLDEMDVAEWSADDRGQYIGYLPQDIELFAGTIRENIARMNDGDPALVIAAAKKAGIHDMVLRMEKGYETEIGEGGAALSGGQRQRIALARALYGNPSLLVLDEPNANLDSVGESALMRAMDNLRAEGMTIIVIAHRPNILRHVDKILVLKDGMLQEFGPRDEVMMKLQGVQKALPGPDQTIQVKKDTEHAGGPQRTKVRTPEDTDAADIKVARKFTPTRSAPLSKMPLKKANGVHVNGSGGPRKRPAVLTMAPSEKIKAKIQSLTTHPLSDSDISKIYALFVKGDQEGALKYIEEIKR